MAKCAIFLDGGYLQKVSYKYMQNKRIDFSKLSNELARGCDILRTYYYHCMPYKSKNNPKPEDVARYNRMQVFVNAIEALDNYEARMGVLVHRGIDKTSGKPIYQQKRVDILLACDLVQLSTKNRIDKAIVFSADSDFIPAIQIAKNEGVEVTLVYDPAFLPSASYVGIADKRIEIDSDFFKRVLTV